MGKKWKAALLVILLFGGVAIDLARKWLIAPYSEIAEFCARNSIAYTPPLDIQSRRDVVISEKIGPLCNRLARLDGLDFGSGLTGYTCRIAIPRMDDSEYERYLRAEMEHYKKTPSELHAQLEYHRKRWEPVERLENTLGRDISLSQFDDAGLDPDDLLERFVPASKRARADNELTLPLSQMALFEVVILEVVVLADDSGHIVKSILTNHELSTELKSVRTLTGAALLIYLRKLTGMLDDPVKFDQRNGDADLGLPVCAAESLVENEDGWTIKGATITQSCWPTLKRDFVINRSGQTLVTHEEIVPDRQSMCRD